MKPARENSSRNNSSNKADVKNRPPQGQQSNGQQNSGNKGDGASSGKKEGRRDNRGNRRWRKNRFRDNRNKDRTRENGNEQENWEVKKNRVILTCDICGKDIKEISSAIGSGESNKPVHFDCMIEKLKKENPLQPDERIVYLGAGNFGIVKQEKNKAPKNFSIVKKIEVENRDEKPLWRSDQDRVKYKEK